MENGASSYHRFLEGDESAFDEIMDAYRESLIFFINRFVRNPAAAEDLAVDVFVELLLHKGRYNFTTSLKTYLFTLGRSRALNYLKRESKFRVIELTDAEAETADYRALEERLIAQEEKIAVNAALNRLPEEYRTVLHLIYFEELSYEEAAAPPIPSRRSRLRSPASASTSRTLRPNRASAQPKPAVTVDLPAPPFPEVTTVT